MTYWLQNFITFFLVLKIPVWNFDSVALLSRLIPTFLLSIFYNTFSFSNNGAHFLSNSFTLCFISVLSHFFLDNPAVLHVRHIIALFFMPKLTFVLSYIISLGFSSLITNLLMFSVALVFILSLAFLGVFSVTFLFILS